MMSVVVPVRFKRKELRLIDELVKSGLFRSRSEAIRLLVLKSAEEMSPYSMDEEVIKVVRAMLKSLREDRDSLKIISQKTAAEIIGEVREDEDIH